MLDRVGTADLDDDEVATIQQVIVDTGALDALERTSPSWPRRPSPRSTAAGLTDEARRELTALADFVVARRI